MSTYELREKSLKIAHEARNLLNTVKEDNSNFAEVQTQFERMMKDSDDFASRADLAEKAEARSKSFDQIVTETPATEVRSGGSSDEKRAAAFIEYVRGKKSLEELRAVGITGQDGVITPTTFATTLLTHLVSEGPMLDPSVVTILTTSTGNAIDMPTFNDDVEAVIIGENTQHTEGDMSFGSKSLGAFKYSSKLVRVSGELLQDAAVPVDNIVSRALAKRIGRGTNRHLTVGDGVGKPKGLVPSTLVGVTAASATGVAADELFALQHSIDAAYRPKGRFMLNDTAILKYRTMKDAEGRYIWQPGLTVGAPNTILGSAYVINPYMSGTFTSGAVVTLYGDFSAYTVRQAKDVYLRRLTERYADYDQVGFVALARYDGILTDDAAVKALKLA